MSRSSLVSVTAEFLADSELFRGVPARVLGDVARQAMVVRHRSGARIFSQGEPATHAHLALLGRIKIVQSGAGGEQVIVRLIRPGETFGTVGLYVDGLYPAEAVAASEAVEARWGARAFMALAQRHPEIALNLVRLVGARLHEAQTRLREISTERVEQRVASALLRAALKEHSTEDGIRLPLSRRDIAELAGTTLYTASRVLANWQRRGVIRGGRATLTILQLPALSQLSSR